MTVIRFAVIFALGATGHREPAGTGRDAFPCKVGRKVSLATMRLR